MKNPNVLREARAFRLELVLLGMALAQEGDREAILGKMSNEDFCSELVSDCFQAIRTKDPDDIVKMKKILANWGLEVNGKVVDSLMETVKVCKSRYAFEKACLELNHCSSAEREAYVAKAEECYQSLKSTLGEFDDPDTTDDGRVA